MNRAAFSEVAQIIQNGLPRVPARKCARGQSQPERENRVLVRCALKSKPQKTSVMRCYLNVKVRVLQIHGRKPVPGANLHQDLFQRYHPERTFAKRSVDGSEI